jgi:hypothetical protein
LLSGGFDNYLDEGNVATAVQYDPSTNTWSKPIAMNEGRYDHASALLANGTVLIAGGYDYKVTHTTQASTDLFDPAKNAWSPGVPMNHARSLHTATLLKTGDVLVAGGMDDRTVLSNVELYSQDSLPLAGACTHPGQCSSGFCADGVCCDTACNGPCDACSIAAGATSAGHCRPLTGLSCADNLCVQGGTCQAGRCVGAKPIPCIPTDECHAAGECDPLDGHCSNPPRPYGALCSHGTCRAGMCERSPRDGGERARDAAVEAGRSDGAIGSGGRSAIADADVDVDVVTDGAMSGGGRMSAGGASTAAVPDGRVSGEGGTTPPSIPRGGRSAADNDAASVLGTGRRDGGVVTPPRSPIADRDGGAGGTANAEGDSQSGCGCSLKTGSNRRASWMALALFLTRTRWRRSQRASRRQRERRD